MPPPEYLGKPVKEVIYDVCCMQWIILFEDETRTVTCDREVARMCTPVAPPPAPTNYLAGWATTRTPLEEPRKSSHRVIRRFGFSGSVRA